MSRRHHFPSVQIHGECGLVENAGSINSLKSVVNPTNGYKVSTGGFYTPGDGGAGEFYWDSAEDKSNHNGGTIVDPDHTSTPGAVGWYTAENVGNGCWKRGWVGAINVKWFGVYGDGIYDDTAATIACHVFANLTDTPVSYVGCQLIGLQANAQIPMKTSTDFSGCELVILGGVNIPPTWSSFNDLYIITDDACPIETAVGAIDANNLIDGSHFPTLGLFDGHGFAQLRCGFQIPNRNTDGTVDYKQSFKVNREGKASSPLSVNLTAFAAAITVRYRNTSKKRLIIKNASLTEGAWNNQRVFNIQRCNVEVSDFTLLFTGGSYDNIQNIIYLKDISDVTIRNYISTGRPTAGAMASSNLYIDGGADILIDNMNALMGWGATSTLHTNGIRYSNCVLNRIDSHEGGHNIFADNCDLHATGLTYGWGGGVLSVKNCRIHKGNAAISSRVDYGGQMFGDLVVCNCELTSSLETLRVVDLDTFPIGASIPIYAPRTITVKNIVRSGGTPIVGATEIIPVSIRVENSTSVVYAPNLIEVSDIKYHRPWRFGLRLDTLNMERYPFVYSAMQVICSNIYATQPPGVTQGIVDLPRILTPTEETKPEFHISNCNHIQISCQSAQGAIITLTNCGVNAILVDPAAVLTPLILLRSCRLHSPVLHGTHAPIGAASTNTSSYTSMIGCDITAMDWDLSDVSIFQGNTVRVGAVAPILPGGVTFDDIFMGYKTVVR